MFLNSSVRDGFSLSLGVISIISWTIAEIPQILTNYKEKSTEGLSIVFLTTWLIGDFFNIVGCVMEPATLPIQFYMAVLYTMATTVLYGQSIYYGHIYQRPQLEKPLLEKEEEEEEEDEATRAHSTKPMLCVVSMFLFLGTLYLSDLNKESRIENRGREFVVGAVRKLLRVNLEEESNSKIGVFLGWAMAAIFMGGRIPQICLNMKRGHVEGLNPMMFLFALVGNVTYVASILVKSTEWIKIAPNLPWLVDAGGCVVLDFLILLQFFHFKDKHSKKHQTLEEFVV